MLCNMVYVIVVPWARGYVKLITQLGVIRQTRSLYFLKRVDYARLGNAYITPSYQHTNTIRPTTIVLSGVLHLWIAQWRNNNVPLLIHKDTIANTSDQSWQRHFCIVEESWVQTLCPHKTATQKHHYNTQNCIIIFYVNRYKGTALHTVLRG